MIKENTIFKYEGVNLIKPDFTIKYFDRGLFEHPHAKFAFINYSRYKKQCIDLTIPVFITFKGTKKLNPLLLNILTVLDPLDIISKSVLNDQELIKIRNLNSGPINKRIPDHSPIYLEFNQLNKSLLSSKNINLKAYLSDSCVHNNSSKMGFFYEFWTN